MDVLLFICLRNSRGLIQIVFVGLTSSVTHYFESCVLLTSLRHKRSRGIPNGIPDSNDVQTKMYLNHN